MKKLFTALIGISGFIIGSRLSSKNLKNNNLNQNSNRWIALYLSGLYPWNYRMPDRLEFFDKLNSKDSNRYNQKLLSQFKNKTDMEFFQNLLDSFKRNYSLKEYNSLLLELWIPNDVKTDPRI